MFGWAPTDGGSRWPVCLTLATPLKKLCSALTLAAALTFGLTSEKVQSGCARAPSTAASEHTLISIFKFQICVGSACLVPPQNAATSSIYSDFKWGARMCFLGVPPTLDFNIQISTGGPASRKCRQNRTQTSKSQNWLFHPCWVLLLYWKYGIHALTHIGLLADLQWGYSNGIMVFVVLSFCTKP